MTVRNDEDGQVIIEKIIDKFYENGIILFRDPRLGNYETLKSKWRFSQKFSTICRLEEFLVGLSQKLPSQHKSPLVSCHLPQFIPRDQFLTLLKENPLAYRVSETQGYILQQQPPHHDDDVSRCCTVTW